MLLRLFAAIPVPSEVWPGLVGLQKGLEGASWRPRENFHVTLRFFGEIDHPTARELDRELGELRFPQFELVARGTGWFGRREPHAVWAGVDGADEAATDALALLARRCERAARRVGLAPETRPFKPHITLAYLHNTPLDSVGAYAKRTGAYRSEPFWADRFHLYSSQFGQGPSRYTAEADYPLGNV